MNCAARSTRRKGPDHNDIHRRHHGRHRCGTRRDGEAPSKRGASPKKSAPKARETTTSAKSKKQAKPAQKAAKPAAERSNKKAEAIAMMKRAKGVTLAEIKDATGWQKHTVRGSSASSAARAAARRSSPRRTPTESALIRSRSKHPSTRNTPGKAGAAFLLGWRK